ELELAPKMRTDKREHYSPIHAVVLEHPFSQQRAVSGAAPNHSVQSNYAGYRSVTRVCPTDVRAAWGFESCRVIFLIEEIVVASSIGAQFSIVLERAKRQWRATAPASHHFCS